MIHSHDRSKWVGASDIEELIALSNSDKATAHSNFVAVKTGLIDNPNIKSIYMTAGDLYERQIVDYSEVDRVEYDKSIAIPKYSLRVNLDGNTSSKIIEAKTKKFTGKVHFDRRSSLWKRYYLQVQTQMFAWREYYGENVTAVIKVYYLDELDYEAIRLYKKPLPIDPERLEIIPIKYDDFTVKNMIIPALEFISPYLTQMREEHEEGSVW